MDAGRARRVRREIEDLAHAGADSSTLSSEAERLFSKVINFDRACWHNVDPASWMITSIMGESAPYVPSLPVVEYGPEDVNQYIGLAKRRPSVGALAHDTEGSLAKCRRYREVLEPMGVTDELTAAFISGSMFWGCARFYRERGREPFDQVEVAFVGSLTVTLAEAYRRALLANAGVVQPAREGPGLLILDDTDQIEAIDAGAEAWLQDLIDQPTGPLPNLLYGLAARARTLEESHREPVTRWARARLPGRSGQWLLLQATRMRRKSGNATAIVVEPVPLPELAPLIVHSYGLTERERQVTEQALRGLSTKEIATALKVSRFTVTDHLKSVFEKVDARSRGELVNRIFFDHYYPAILASEAPGLNAHQGGFGAAVT